jgi:hypothetical protein
MSFKFSIIALFLGGVVIAVTSSQAKEISPPVTEPEAPQVRALLEHGWAAETGLGQAHNGLLAAALYCKAGELGSAEGFYRAGLIYYSGRHVPRDKPLAAGFFSVASQLGHHGSAELLEAAHPAPASPPPCISVEQATLAGNGGFDVEQYVDELPRHKRHVAGLIRKLAPRYLVDVRLALAIASVESNFEVRARSPKNAQGVMQLIPETAARFSVKNPFNAEQNIRGGLAYLRWLLHYFEGDVTRAVAAYNAGEKSVDRYGGIPPYNETRDYVRLVLYYAGR